KQPSKFFLISNTSNSKYNLKLASTLGFTAAAEISCDAPVTLKIEDTLNKTVTAKRIAFELSNRENVSIRPAVLKFTPNISKCSLVFWNPKDEKIAGGVNLINEVTAFPLLKKLNQHKETCDYKSDSNPLPGQNMFFTNQFQNMTCAQNAEKIETLDAPESGFRAKVETLLGSPVSDEFITSANPYAKLDFSRAPKFDAIFVSSLVFRSDFYGNVMVRLLKYHADRGTLVQILTTDYMQTDKDHVLLQNLARENGNIRLQEYKYYAVNEGLSRTTDKLNEFHRNMHVKVFVTLSSEKPENNVIVTGGRNIHDGFLFLTVPDHSDFPELVQYGKDKEENFVHWSDFEIKITSPKAAQTMYSHLLTFWNRETKSQNIDFIDSSNGRLSIDPHSLDTSSPLIRHIMSVPFNDNMQLEKLFVEMIDKAEHTVKISSPYLRPTDAISSAIERAAARGVDVTIQTRIDLKGDTLDWLYTQMNKESINQLQDKVKIYEWTAESILHSKFMLIDNDFAFIGSVNVSRRSFVHDIESGLLIYSPDFVAHMSEIFEQYTKGSRLVTEKQEHSTFPRILLKIFENEF
ncbi:MAG: phosphatidylserine/phosphatidylglycerophosphate/cardiolipin synthase family protein, partial [Bdellovibrionales bacterium]|nr:phosphatidylserine/phosphatidylglycerophosphate/cardiolipin synthase family protein [Bdellovibrionales bacterium]